ncbi:MAG: hypothetical protein EOP53_27670 [Sphingobacteriales bacterium]|nr:MAG: hypothetical protein EOP53_27670 [Sphingobacteriales bacterium]
MLKPDYQGKVLMIGITLLSINILTLLAFTLFIKASMHANAIAIILSVFGLAYGIISALDEVPVLFYVILSSLSIFFGIVIWQRIASKAHTWKELLAGFISGLISVGIMLFYIDVFGY